MRTAPRQTTRSEGESGFTLVEVVVSALLVVAVVGLTLSTMAAIQSLSRKEEAELKERGSYREVLRQLEEELTLSSAGVDPKTNQPRFQIFTDADGRQAIRFQKLTGARVVGGELEPIWSDFIEVRVTADGTVTRTAEGKTTILGTGIRDLTFAVTMGGRFQVFCTTRYRDPIAGHLVDQTYEKFILPKN